MKIHLVLLVTLFTQVGFAQSMSRQEINKIVPGSKEKTHGLREFKPVLKGVLYRGGGPGGKKPIGSENLTALCEQGFTDAGYLYPDNWKGNTTESCAKGKIDYRRYGYFGASEAHGFLSRVHELIKNGGKMFVHCWNGWHASGEVAAYALIQFCDFTPQEADAYWQQNRGDKAIISRVKKFQRISGMDISDEDKARVCPARN